jgi:hypothetical protein
MAMSSSIRFPHNWKTLTTSQKQEYLVNTRQARDFSHAGSILNEMRRHKQEKQAAERAAPLAHQPFRKIRLPYADN